MTLLAELLKINPYAPPSPLMGICGNISPQYQYEFGHLVQRWPNYSGNPSYPVPHPDYRGSPVLGYNMTHDMWVGPYGDLRRELLQFCIDRLLDDELHRSLVYLKEVGPSDRQKGICGNITTGFWSLKAKRLKEHFLNWPSYSGNPEYPIEGGSLEYHRNPDKWADPRRHDLLDFLLEQTK